MDEYSGTQSTNINAEQYRETVVHGTPRFPMQVYKNNFEWYAGHLLDWHWHSEIELSMVLSGRLKFGVNGEDIEVGAGDGFFINTEVMHKQTAISDGGKYPVLITVCFSPDLIGDCGADLIQNTYVKPILGGSVRYMALSHEID